jgi:uncharacterized protein (DUF433 family)
MSVQSPAMLDLSKYIEVRLFGERPHIRGRRIPIATVAYNARTHGWSVAETAHNFGLSESEVLTALLYYAEHQTEIDAQEIVNQAELDEAFRRYGERD